MKTKIKLGNLMKVYDMMEQTRLMIKSYSKKEDADRYQETVKGYQRKLSGLNLQFEKESEKVQSALDEVQKRSKVRTITVKDICCTLTNVDKKLDIPKKYKKGIQLSCDYNAQKFPNAYRYQPDSTHFFAEHNGSEWILTGACRRVCTNKNCHLDLTDEAKEKILDNYKNF